MKSRQFSQLRFCFAAHAEPDLPAATVIPESGIAASMRWTTVSLVALLASGTVALSGCTLEEAPKPLFGYCPQWTQGPGMVTQTIDVSAGVHANQTLAPPTVNGTIAWEFQSRPFDMVRLQIQSGTVPDGATLILRGYTPENGTIRHNWRQFDANGTSWVPSLEWGAGPLKSRDYEIFLTSVDHADQPKRLPIILSWSLEGALAPASVSYTATFHYKVCGAQV